MGASSSRENLMGDQNVRYEKRIVMDVEAFAQKDVTKWEHLAFTEDYAHQWQIRLKLDKASAYVDVELEMYLNATIDWYFFATIKCSLFKNNYERSQVKKTPKRMRFNEGEVYVFKQFLKYDLDLWKLQRYIFPENIIVIEVEFREHEPTESEIKLEPGKMAYFEAMKNEAIFMYNKAILTDCVIIVHREGILAHQIVLSAVSAVFRRIFAVGRQDPNFNGKIYMSSYNYKIVKAMVDFAYYGPLIFIEQDSFPELLQIADDVQFRHLKAFCENCLCKQINESNKDTFIELAIRHSSAVIMKRAQEVESKSKKHKSIKTSLKPTGMVREKEDQRTAELARRLLEGTKSTISEGSSITLRTNSSPLSLQAKQDMNRKKSMYVQVKSSTIS